MITEEVKKFYFLLKQKVQELNGEGFDFKRDVKLSDGLMKIRLIGETSVDFLVELPKNQTELPALIKDGKRFPCSAESLVDKIIFATDQRAFRIYLPHLNPAIIPT